MNHYTQKATLKVISLLDEGRYIVKTETVSDIKETEFKNTHVVFHLTRGRIKAFRADHVLDIETEIVD